MLCPYAVQVREEQPGFPAGLEREAGCIHTCQRGGSSQQQEQQRLRRQILGAAHDQPKPLGEQIIQEIVTSLRPLFSHGAAHSQPHIFLEGDNPGNTSQPSSSCPHQRVGSSRGVKMAAWVSQSLYLLSG